VASPDIAHKTEVGGVVLDLCTPQAVEAAVLAMGNHIRSIQPDARIDGYLVAPMAAEGIDCIVGLRYDPALGPVIVFGAGGIMAEWLEDISIRLAPVDTVTAHEMVAETKIYKLLAGWRGAPAGDLNALAATIVAVSGLSHATSSPHDLEINPLR